MMQSSHLGTPPAGRHDQRSAFHRRGDAPAAITREDAGHLDKGPIPTGRAGQLAQTDEPLTVIAFVEGEDDPVGLHSYRFEAQRLVILEAEKAPRSGMSALHVLFSS